tara:strand:- start:360 stop:683 length:324 start_codon:yes stop_codon:yes gene_type:complete
MNYIIVAILQVTMSVLKVFDIKWSYENKTLKLTLLSLLMTSVWIVSTTLGVGAFMKGDYWMILIYIGSSGVGKIFALKVLDQNKYRRKVFENVKSGVVVRSIGGDKK